MKTRVLLSIICIAVVGFSVQQALADPPTTWEVSYGIHDTPSSRQSPITFLITLSLTRDDIDGDSIGWDIDSIEIRRFNSSGETIGLWAEENPTIPTMDGLWWIDHDDANDPQMDEFVLPPHLEGTADADDPNDDDLLYDVEGQTYDGDPVYDITAALDYEFTLEGEEDPIENGATDPTEVDPPIST